MIAEVQYNAAVLNLNMLIRANAACTLAENRPKLSDFLVGRSFLGV